MTGHELPASMRNLALVSGVCGSLMLAGCPWDSPPEPKPTTESCFVDRDCDGIRDDLDKTPDLKDRADVDGDGLGNTLDPKPYEAAESIIPDTTTPNQPVPGPSSPTYVPVPGPTFNILCTPTGRDSDGDGRMDGCDLVYDTDNKDSDNDGLPDTRDAYPYSWDADRDGRPDGYDRRPNESYKTEEKRAEERRQAQRAEEQRAEERRAEERRQAERDQQRRDEERRRQQNN